jgi:hypothetical protein
MEENEWDMDIMVNFDMDDFLTDGEVRFKYHRELEIVDDETEFYGDFS